MPIILEVTVVYLKKCLYNTPNCKTTDSGTVLRKVILIWCNTISGVCILGCAPQGFEGSYQRVYEVSLPGIHHFWIWNGQQNWQLTFMLALDDFDILYVLESSSDSKTISFSFDDFVYLVYNIKLWQWCSVFAYYIVFSTWWYTWCLCIIHGYSDESRLRTPANVCIADEKSQ